MIARNGQTYRILDKKYRANHAGLSMWNGETGINRSSVGIELVGYHNRDITASQYKSVRFLIELLKNTYRLDNRAVLTHSQVAYAKPNPQKPYNHRGRKHCARNFDRIRAGIGPTWPYDPDVKAGRLKPEICQQLLDGQYTPQPVKQVLIPKPDGSSRMLGIPIVVDRLIQQALLQVLTPMYDPGFSDHSFGFRPGRNAHQAVRQAKEYIAQGHEWVRRHRFGEVL